MMENLYAIKMAIFVFPIVALITLIPYLIYQYKIHGSVIFTKALVVYSFMYYLITIFFLVMLPLYPRSVVSNMTTPYADFKFLGFLRTWKSIGVFDINNSQMLIPFISSKTFQEPFFNLIMTIPFGVYLRYYFKREWWEVIFLSFFLSCFFEFSQLSGLYGFYSRPHRLFQIDDLILNTLGGIIGFIITPIFIFLMPTKEELDLISIEKSAQVGPLRRLVALFIDVLSVLIIVSLVLIVIYKDKSFIDILRNIKIYIKLIILNKNVYILTAILLTTFFIVLPITMKGSTIGQRMVGTKIVNDNEDRLSLKRLIFYRLICVLQLAYILLCILISLNRMDALKTLYDKSSIIVVISFSVYLVLQLYSIFKYNKTFNMLVSRVSIESINNNSSIE